MSDVHGTVKPFIELTESVLELLSPPPPPPTTQSTEVTRHLLSKTDISLTFPSSPALLSLLLRYLDQVVVGEMVRRNRQAIYRQIKGLGSDFIQRLPQKNCYAVILSNFLRIGQQPYIILLLYRCRLDKARRLTQVKTIFLKFRRNSVTDSGSTLYSLGSALFSITKSPLPFSDVIRFLYYAFHKTQDLAILKDQNQSSFVCIAVNLTKS